MSLVFSYFSLIFHDCSPLPVFSFSRIYGKISVPLRQHGRRFRFRHTKKEDQQLLHSMKEQIIKHNILRKCIYLFLLAVCLFFFYHCPFDYLFGISCPGCGMTRALISFLLLRFDLAFYYHPGIYLVIPGFILWCLDYFKLLTLKRRTKKVLLSVGITALILIYFIRLFFGSDIVQIDIRSGIIYRLFNYLPNWL